MRLETVLVPEAPAVVWGSLTVVVVALHAFLLLAGAVSVMRSARLTRRGRLLWLVVIFALPVLGAIGWFVWGRHARLEQPVP